MGCGLSRLQNDTAAYAHYKGALGHPEPFATSASFQGKSTAHAANSLRHRAQCPKSNTVADHRISGTKAKQPYEGT
ncbi:MAG: hypothetical protein Q9220_007717 [cf. Caloplaca sp. 1 TL-2023]